MPKRQVFALRHLSEETELDVTVKFTLVREKVSFTGYNRNIWIGPSEVPCGSYLCHHLLC